MPPKPTALLAGACLVTLTALTAGPAGAAGPAQNATSQSEQQPEKSAAPDWTALAAARLPLLEPCQVPGVEETVLCGTLEVREDRSRTDGRRIGLHAVVLPAHVETPPADPITVFAGGPGGAATRRAPGLARVEVLRARDILLVDQRGTGASHPLDCDLGAPGDATGELPEMFPPAEVRACAERLSRTADLSLYTSVQHADDVEEVRQRLGYGPLNLRGGSYGTHAAMVFAQRHPESTRTLFAIGVDSPLRSNLAERGIWADHTLAGVALQCAHEEACARIAPRMDRMVADLLGSLGEGPRAVEVADPEQPGETMVVHVGRDWLAEQIRLLLYYGFTSRALPWAVHRAHAEDDWRPLTELALLIERFFSSTLADGVLLTVQCSEGMDFDTGRALARGKSTLFGNYRLEQQIQGCAAWPHRKTGLTLGVERPRPLPVPTLLLSGAWDPVTPPAYAEDATAYFPNALHLVLAEAQHGPFDQQGAWVCVHQIWADLIDQGSLEGLDASCIGDLVHPPFLVDAESFRTHLEETLAPLAE